VEMALGLTPHLPGQLSGELRAGRAGVA
jgi:hypothetical protein